MRWRLWLGLLLAATAFVSLIVSGSSTPTARAANGTLVDQVTFTVPCRSGVGVGIAFDGSNLWYSCYRQSPDLYKADPGDGHVTASYNVAGGLGALAWDEGRRKLWAGAGCGSGQTGKEIYLFDPDTGTGSLRFDIPGFNGNCLDDGLAYDGEDDSLYHSWDGARNIRHISAADGTPKSDDGFAWGGSGCYNSGLAIGGDLLYQGSDGCLYIWVVDKNSKASAFDFPSPGIRDEDLECDSRTFPGKTVMWSKDAYNDTAYAFEIPLGSCNFGGVPVPPNVDRDIVFVRGIDSRGTCDGANDWVKNYLESDVGKSFFGEVRIGQYLNFDYRSGESYDCPRSDVAYTQNDTCDGVAEAAGQLKSLIDGQATAKVTIVAHSMGGLVAAYLAGHDWGDDWAESNIASVVTFDSPLQGLSDRSLDGLTIPSVCPRETGSIPDMGEGSGVVGHAANAAKVVPIYPLDATQLDILPANIEYVPRESASLEDARYFRYVNWCEKPGPDPDPVTCEPPRPIDDDHSSSWGRRFDEHNDNDKGFLVGCAVAVEWNCEFLRAPVSQGQISEAHMAVGPPANRMRVISNFGSIVRMTLISPDGTIYGPDGAGPVLAYGLDEVSETYVIENPAPGDWTIQLNGIEVAPEGEDVLLALLVEEIGEVEGDSTPPTSTISLDPASPDGDNGWYVSPVTATLTAEDDPGGSGVASTEYRLDGGGWQPYTDPFTLSTVGTTSVDARSTDNAANVEDPPVSATVQIDQTAPSVSVEIPAEGVAVQDGVTLAASANDATSGVADVRLYVREDDGGSGIAVGFEDLAATYNSGTGHWEHSFDSTALPDGYYVALAKAEDNAGNEGWSDVRHFSIRNWAVLELLPASENNKAGRTMPVKFSLRIAAAVDPAQPFVYNEDLTIKIYEAGHPGDVLQTSMYGDGARNYRIDQTGEKYITNFKTLKRPKDYTVDIWRHNTIDFLVGSFGFRTVK